MGRPSSKVADAPFTICHVIKQRDENPNQSSQHSLPKADEPPWSNPLAAYIHIPFCAHHCCYCDFAVTDRHDHLMDTYLDALACEIALLETPRPMQTIFIGGGTPTHLQPTQLQRLLQVVRTWLPLEAGGEFSVEANPHGLTEAKVEVLVQGGVNRFSLGVQSFQPAKLKTLERDHRAEDVECVLALLRRFPVTISLDLIFGVPGETVHDWRDDLRQALALGPDHVSTYGLTYEKGTRLWKQRQRQLVQPVDEDIELAMYELAMDFLAGAGFEHYEISNYALPGCRCRHNEVYWANNAYFGFGMGAARYVAGRREVNSRSLDTYLRRVLAGQPATFQSETLSPEESARETMALQLRRSDGIERPQFKKRTGFELDAIAGSQLARQVERGLLLDDGTRVRLTRRGKCLADAVICDLL
ncbi:MAG: coproporphyrinogen III oxidase [Gemmatales bacterium]|nr:MAG: coproporphyrinogen III oxidase [Gemmatales bacterium]